MVVDQYDVFLVNRNIGTVIAAPMTTKSRNYPTRVAVRFKGKDGWVVLDQIRTIDKRRLVRKLGKIEGAAITEVKSVLSEMLVE